jgi:16S rRNA (guanine1207-N2)-methyltransferase
VFDMGCGYGLLGLVCARLAQNGRVWLSDVSMRAVTCATENMARNQITNAQVGVGDLYESVGDTPLDLILSNPPFHEGNKTAWPLIDGAIERLNPNGVLMLVVMRAGPYIKRMETVFGHVEICAEAGGYTVLKCQKKI